MSAHKQPEEKVSTVLDAREWLAAKGLAKPGTRGRFSNAAKEALAAAAKDGLVFSTSATPTATVTVTADNGEKVTERREINIYAPHPPARRSGTLVFVNRKGKRVNVSATEACAHCSMSFGWCDCDVPTFRVWQTGELIRLEAAIA
jgi:hypothetical protein